MTVRRRVLKLLCIGLTVVSAGSGCRLFNKGSSGEGWSLGTRDPLFGRDRIPATNLPTGRENARGSRDPLLGSPTADTDNAISRDLPPGRKEPFRTGPETTAAGLAGGRSSDDPLLAIRGDEFTDRRATGNNTGRGPVVLQPRGDNDYDQTLNSLKRYGVKVGEPLRDGNEFILRGELEAADGIRRRYEGAGPSAAAAASDLLEQVRTENGR